MGKVRYKKPSENFQKITSVTEDKPLRYSIGKEEYVGEYYFLSVDSLIPYHLQARRIFDEIEIQQLASTIKEHGIKSPLLVISSQSAEEKFEVVSGERRLRAARLISMEKVPCIIIDKEKASEIALVENIQRSNLHPVELGDALNALLQKSSWGDVTKLAYKIGKSQSTVSHYLAYSKLPDTIKKYIFEKNIVSRSVLRKVLQCKDVTEMEDVLGIRFSEKPFGQKSILRVNLELDEMRAQDRAIYKLNADKRNKLKKLLLTIVSKIESMNDSE